MATQRRWLKWVIEEAETFDTVLPWERGANRAAWRRHLSSISMRLLSAKP